MDAVSSDLKPEISEELARVDLVAHGKRSLRELARAWNWHVSRVRRFLARLDADTPSDTAADTPEVCRDLEADTPPLCRDTPPARTGDGSTDDIFDWGWENEDIVTHGSPALAIYATVSRQIAIRCDSFGDTTVPADQRIMINPRDVDLICQRLREVADEVLGSRGQGPSEEGR
jgi:hypothetical protein